MRDRGFRYIFNLPYRCEMNPIELVFSQVKSYFKALRAKKFMGLHQDTHHNMISKAFKMVKKKNVIKCI